ncbi:MAG: hypothetical protein ACD_50C00032G0002 [uncultured bacterium]|nr:MAG: hypothetical protein ACD_50C00032G0002 [uncultured bacterium]OGH14078.1 MAG: hypothetical protein A2687_02325 [Candidatus Levybacteria bacterium RIFCSPHIGHO2_01_FULL_38_26]
MVENIKHHITSRINSINKPEQLGELGQIVDAYLGVPSIEEIRKEMVSAPINFSPDALPEVMPESLGGRLGVYIQRLGVTKAEFARRLDYSDAYVHLLVSDQRSHPSLGDTILMARILRLNPQETEDFVERAGHGLTFNILRESRLI